MFHTDEQLGGCMQITRRLTELHTESKISGSHGSEYEG
jgi:hypothetical protein